jgi:RNA-directed DNA polymerase
LREHFPRTSRAGRSAKVNRVRFADDFLVTGATKDVLEREVKPLIEHFLQDRGLELSREKTLVTHGADGFDFLGQPSRKRQWGQHQKAKLYITPSRKSVKAFLTTVRARLKASHGRSAGALIEQRNPLIAGWALYHRHVVSKAVFHAVDHAIFKALWAWAVRRHRHKTRRWVKDQYFHVHGPRRWVFTGSASPEPTSLRGEAASARTGVTKGLSCMGETHPCGS